MEEATASQVVPKYNPQPLLSVLLPFSAVFNRQKSLRASGGLMEGHRARWGQNHDILSQEGLLSNLARKTVDPC